MTKAQKVLDKRRTAATHLFCSVGQQSAKDVCLLLLPIVVRQQFPWRLEVRKRLLRAGEHVFQRDHRRAYSRPYDACATWQMSKILETARWPVSA